MKFIYSVLGRILKLVFGAILVGSLCGIVAPILIKLFSLDGLFEGWEVLITLVSTILILVFFVLFISGYLSRILDIKPQIDFFNFKQFRFLSIPGILTIIVPLGIGLFGGTGNEPIWIFILLGIVGCLFWSVPLFLWLLISNAIKKSN